VLVTGGLDRGPLNSAEVYDPSTETWTTTTSMYYTRWYSRASVLRNGKVLITGGSNDQILNSVELYDPSTQNWTIIDSMNNVRYSHTASVLMNEKILITGGRNLGTALNTAELYSSF
jgi:N-acetylneuraminic acid mutarotase